MKTLIISFLLSWYSISSVAMDEKNLWSIWGHNPEEAKIIKRSALLELKTFKHWEPDPGTSWGNCQITALTGLSDLNLVETGDLPDSLVVRYLLQVKDNGESPDHNDYVERAQRIGISCTNISHKNKISNNKAKNFLRYLQEWFRQDMAKNIGIELDERNSKPKDDHAAFDCFINTLKNTDIKIALIIYPGTPGIEEVRSLTGAEHFVPFCKDKNNGSFKLDKSGRYIRHVWSNYPNNDDIARCEVDEEEFIEGEKVRFDHTIGLEWGIIDRDFPISHHVPLVTCPKEGESFLALHLSIVTRDLKSAALRPKDIIHQFKLAQFDPISFLQERFALMYEQELSEDKLGKINFSELSMLHVSQIIYSKDALGYLHVPCDFKSVFYQRSPSDFYCWWPPKKLLYHGLFIEEDINRFIKPGGGDEFEAGCLIYKIENFTRIIIRLVKTKDGRSFDMTKSYIGAFRWSDDNRYNQKFFKGDYLILEDNIESKKIAGKFILSLIKYHDRNFCLNTQVKLNKLGLTKEVLSNIAKNDLDKWLLKFENWFLDDE